MAVLHWAAGLLAAALSLVLVRSLLVHGSLSPVAWMILLGCIILFAVLMRQVLRWVDPERREYLEAIADTMIATEPRNFILNAEQAAERFQVQLHARGVELDGSTETLPRLSHFLAQNGRLVQQDAMLVEGAAAYYGEILRVSLSGEWEVWEKSDLCDAVVAVGGGVTRHQVSPGFMAFSVAKDPTWSLEMVLEHERTELAPSPVDARDRG